jgi:hypothetical protein
MVRSLHQVRDTAEPFVSAIRRNLAGRLDGFGHGGNPPADILRLSRIGGNSGLAAPSLHFPRRDGSNPKTGRAADVPAAPVGVSEGLTQRW